MSSSASKDSCSIGVHWRDDTGKCKYCDMKPISLLISLWCENELPLLSKHTQYTTVKISVFISTYMPYVSKLLHHLAYTTSQCLKQQNCNVWGFTLTKQNKLYKFIYFPSPYQKTFCNISKKWNFHYVLALLCFYMLVQDFPKWVRD